MASTTKKEVSSDDDLDIQDKNEHMTLLDKKVEEAKRYLCKNDLLKTQPGLYRFLHNNDLMNEVNDFYRQRHHDLGLSSCDTKEEVLEKIMEEFEFSRAMYKDIDDYCLYRASFFNILLADKTYLKRMSDNFFLTDEEYESFRQKKVAHRKTLSIFGWGNVFWPIQSSLAHSTIVSQKIENIYRLAGNYKDEKSFKEDFPDLHKLLKGKGLLKNVIYKN